MRNENLLPNMTHTFPLIRQPSFGSSWWWRVRRPWPSVCHVDTRPPAGLSVWHQSCPHTPSWLRSAAVCRPTHAQWSVKRQKLVYCENQLKIMGLIFVLDSIKTIYLQGLKLVHTKCILFQSSVYGDPHKCVKRTLKMMDFSVKVSVHIIHSAIAACKTVMLVFLFLILWILTIFNDIN